MVVVVAHRHGIPGIFHGLSIRSEFVVDEITEPCLVDSGRFPLMHAAEREEQLDGPAVFRDGYGALCSGALPFRVQSGFHGLFHLVSVTPVVAGGNRELVIDLLFRPRRKEKFDVVAPEPDIPFIDDGFAEQVKAR